MTDGRKENAFRCAPVFVGFFFLLLFNRALRIMKNVTYRVRRRVSGSYAEYFCTEEQEVALTLR